MPSLSRAAPKTPLPSPTVFSVEPGVYLEGRTGVRIEDLVLLDVAARRVERLTRFPREVLVVG
jgi:Xaa-Pro aminopeptidase